MSGSRRYFAYFDDAGNEWSIQQDESVAESLALGFGQSITAAVAANLQSRLKPSTKIPIQPRYVLAQRTDADGRVVKRRFNVGATSAPIWTGTAATYTVDGEAFAVTARIGEQRFYIPAEDTGLIDGDVDDNITSGV